MLDCTVNRVQLGGYRACHQTTQKAIITQSLRICGHGIGKGFMRIHRSALRLSRHWRCIERGDDFTIEPMINQGKRHTRVLSDGWTAVTKDRKLSAQWEHTILVTPTGYDILTYRAEEEDFPRVG
jgi:Methionine aminopeptidase